MLKLNFRSQMGGNRRRPENSLLEATKSIRTKVVMNFLQAAILLGETMEVISSNRLQTLWMLGKDLIKLPVVV